MTLERPTRDAIRRASRAFDEDARTGVSDGAVRLLFEKWSRNTDPSQVLAKVVLLNHLYNTNIYDVYTIGRNITALDVDRRLGESDLTLVDDIARVTIKGKSWRFYSFATKYCFWHRPDDYQVYDGQVDAALWAYQREDGFGEFKRQDLGQYGEFMRVVDEFRVCYGLTDVSRRELDRFLWTVGQPLVRT